MHNSYKPKKEIVHNFSMHALRVRHPPLRWWENEKRKTAQGHLNQETRNVAIKPKEFRPMDYEIAYKEPVEFIVHKNGPLTQCIIDFLIVTLIGYGQGKKITRSHEENELPLSMEVLCGILLVTINEKVQVILQSRCQLIVANLHSLILYSINEKEVSAVKLYKVQENNP